MLTSEITTEDARSVRYKDKCVIMILFLNISVHVGVWLLAFILVGGYTHQQNTAVRLVYSALYWLEDIQINKTLLLG